MGSQFSIFRKHHEKRKKSQETQTINRTGFLSLPEEVICQIGGLLEPQDLIAMSATSCYLRAALNNDSLWYKYTKAGRSLSNVNSAVTPTFSRPINLRSLEPLCDQRLHYLKQSRLVYNFHNAKFVEHSAHFKDSNFLSAMGGGSSLYNNYECINFKRITYKNKYLFTLCHNEQNESVDVFKIDNTRPQRYTSFKLFTTPDCFKLLNLTLRVIGDLLVVRSCNKFDVYKISLPKGSFSLLHSIPFPYMRTVCVGPARRVPVKYLVVVGHYILYSFPNPPIVFVWEVKCGKEIDPIVPKFKCDDFSILGFSLCEKYILLSNGMKSYVQTTQPSLCVYNLETLKYTDFCAVLEPCPSKRDCTGLLDKSYVVLISVSEQRRNWEHSISDIDDGAHIYVYDLLTSQQLAQRSRVEYSCGRSHIIHRYLLLPLHDSVKVMDLKNLDVIWELQVGKFEFVNYIALPNLFHIVVVYKANDLLEFWDFENQRKCFEIHHVNSFVVSDTFSKLIVVKNKTNGEHTLSVLNFW